MDLLAPPVREHLDSLVPRRNQTMQAMEAYAAQTNFPIIGPAAGYFCYTLARMIGAKRIFELGSGYGYSTSWFARAISDNGSGEVYHVVWDEELSQKARGYLGEMGYGDLIRYRVSEAVAALKETDGPFDLIFNDIDKQGYPDSLPVIKEKLRPGGVLITDNVLWHGAIFDQRDHSPGTRGVREFTRLITQDPDFEATLVPIRDGLMVAVKRG